MTAWAGGVAQGGGESVVLKKVLSFITHKETGAECK